MTSWFLSAFLVLQGADVTTTCVGLARGLREANPLRPQSCLGVTGLQGLQTAGTVYFGQHLPPKQRRWYYIALTGVSAAVVVHNISAIRQAGRTGRGGR